MDLLFANFSKKKAFAPNFSRSNIGIRAWIVSLLAIFVWQLPAWGQAILIDDDGPRPQTGRTEESLDAQLAKSVTTEDDSEKKRLLPKKGNLKSYFDRKDYVDLYQLRSQRRMGVGVEVLGRLGMIGVDFDFNLTPRHSATAGLGAGPQYFSYSLGYRRMLDDNNLSPYFGIAATRMEASGGTPVTETTPGWLSDYFLTERDRTELGFKKNFISPQIGILYTQFYGPSAGAAFFLEIMFVFESESNRTAPAAGLGMMYYL